MSITTQSFFNNANSSKRPVTLFASSDYQLSPDTNGRIDIPLRKKGHIESIIQRFKQLKEQGYQSVFINPGDLGDSGSSGSLLDFQFYTNKRNGLGFGVSDELSAFKKLVVEPFKKAEMPDFETIGNHDVTQTNWGRFFGFLAKQTENLVNQIPGVSVEIPRPNIPRQAFSDYIKHRYGGTCYYRTVGDINVVSLGLYPDKKALAWMEKNVPTDKPIVVFWHYNVSGPFSVEGSFGGPWWTKAEREKAFAILNNKFQTLAVIVGHYHATDTYRFETIPVYVVGGGQYLELTIDPENAFKITSQYHSGDDVEQAMGSEQITPVPAM
ncbi:metallophosphoesterase [Legionella sp. W05-934-2]|jgi:hypothetical protein|uniref:metallophosphoesterase family protein n=1 Tax=Legionella sp. W05-934-2 TaxID=1198649 RepID=UPI0034621495